MQKKWQDGDDSYDQARISTLKREIALSKSELFELVNDDDKLTQKLKYFNREGCKCIDREQFYQAIVFLNEAEITLEYAANCGKTIERSLIITTLHNEACVYQRIWELQKSADYLQAIIYNITSFLQGEDPFTLTEHILDDKSAESQKMGVVLQNKIKLIAYYLQFCAVNSQLKRHENSLNAASRALDILKEICEQLHQYEVFTGIKYHNQLEKNLLLELKNIKDFKEEANNVDQNIQRFLNKAKKSIGMFQKKIKFNYNLLDNRQKQLLQEFSIGSVMQVYPQPVPESTDRRWLKQQLTPLNKLYKAIYISVAHFTMATQLRLIANLRYGQDNPSKRGSTQFRSSQLHHLISAITVALYVPYETVYFQHILNSFKNHYQVDLTQISESTLSEELSNPLEQDDEIHLEISSLYRKKHKEGGQTSQNYKSSVKLTDTNLQSQSPSLHDNLKRSKPKIKNSQQHKQQHSVKQKFKIITDSQRKKNESKSKFQGKSVNKKSKSKKKGQSRTKQVLQSPLSQRKFVNLGQTSKPVIPTSRSKSKNKRKSNSKHISEFSNQKKSTTQVRSDHQYGFKGNGGIISRTNKEPRDKKSLRSSQKRSQLKKSDLQRGSGNEIRFIRQGKSPNNIPKATK